MEKSEIKKIIAEIFKEIFKNDTLVISDELTANDIDSWDSLTHMLLIASIEDAFAIKFKLKELNRMRNVGNMIEVISLKLDDKHNTA
jgi:acyl carrier protein